MFAFSLLFNIILVVLASAIKQKGRKKLSTHTGQEEVKLFADDMGELLELINKLSKVGGYKINMQNQLYFYIIEKKHKNKIKKIIIFTIASKIIK